jgi:hypothetical protein
MLYGIDQPGCEITLAFLDILHYTPTVSSAPYERGTYGSNADIDKSDAGIGIAVLSPRTHDDDGPRRTRRPQSIRESLLCKVSSASCSGSTQFLFDSL